MIGIVAWSGELCFEPPREKTFVGLIWIDVIGEFVRLKSIFRYRFARFTDRNITLLFFWSSNRSSLR